MSRNAFAQQMRDDARREDQIEAAVEIARASRHDLYQRALDNLDTQPGYQIAHPKPKRCVPACAEGCNECDRAVAELRRSEAVGAEFETPELPKLTPLATALQIVDGFLLALAYPLLILLLLSAPAWAGGLAAFLKGLVS